MKSTSFYKIATLVLIIIISLFLLSIFYYFRGIKYIQFSDSAKYAEVARNVYEGRGAISTFAFFYPENFNNFFLSKFTNSGILPVNFLSFFLSFKIFGINDFAVIATSVFYFILTLVFVFLLAKKVFKSNLTATLSTLVVGFNHDLINYATQGASESPFIFEIVTAAYFLSFRKRWTNGVAFLLLVLMYFTRPQAFVYITGLILYCLLINFKTKKALIYFGLVVLAGILVDRFVLSPLSGKFFLYSILNRAVDVAPQNLGGSAISDPLRGLAVSLPSIAELFKKVFYNLYNFYKLMPQIMNPYLFALFVVGLFRWKKDKIYNSFKASSLFMILITIFVTALTIPFFRYIHPIIPLVYIIAVGTLVETISKYEIRNPKQIQNSKFQFLNKHLIAIVTTFLVLFFAVGQILGVIFLDSRFENKTYNIGKPPIYVKLSWILKDNTNKNDIVITNLDTWGSWYGERRTVWFPLEPKQLIDQSTGKIPFDAIYLTSYLIDDENYYMGKSWRLIFENPSDPKRWTCEECDHIAKQFYLKGAYVLNAEEDYEKTDARAILLIKK